MTHPTPFPPFAAALPAALDPVAGRGPRLSFEALVSPHGGPYAMQLAAGECVAIVGRSGGGKSVLLRLVADLDAHDGDAWLDGRSRTTFAAPDWRRQVVYQAAEPAWWEATAALHFRPAELPLVRQLAQLLGISPDRLEVEIERLSTGERQRMALVRSLACEPRVLLLDEPTASLDPASTRAVESLLALRAAAGLSIVVVTHSREQAARVGHRVLEVRDHRLFPA